MPVDKDGNRAQVLTSTDSIPGRMNLGRLYWPYFAGASRDVVKQMLEDFGLGYNFKPPLTDQHIESIPDARMEKGVKRLCRFYQIVSPTMFDEFTRLLTPEERGEWLKMIVNEKPYLHMPSHTEKRFDEMVLEVEKEFSPTYGPVTYRGIDGELTTTDFPVRIAPIYMMALDKIANQFISTDTGHLSHFGVLTGTNRATKHATPWKKSSPRNIGETEGHIYASYGGRRMIGELMDRNASIRSQQQISAKILREEKPGRIKQLIDRNKYPYGMSRSVQFIQQYLRPAGAELRWTPEIIPDEEA